MVGWCASTASTTGSPYRQPAFASDVLRATAWAGEASGSTSVHHTRIARADDNALLCEAETTWILLNPTSGRPVRIDTEVLG